jgi:GMP synthase-like glutamine amidotransferase
MRVHYLMHVPHEDLGGMEAWFVSRGHALTQTRFYLDERPPDPQTCDWLVVMGGPMGVHDEAEHPWLKPEKRFIEQALARRIPVLGVCLGAQLIAEVMGARVTRNAHKEIGWFPVTLSEEGQRVSVFQGLPKAFTPLHWHGDTFSIPDGAQHTARSEACANQAFVYDERVVALQFHVEALPSTARLFWEADAPNIEPGPYVQNAEQILGEPTRFASVYPVMTHVLERMEALGGDG